MRTSPLMSDAQNSSSRLLGVGGAGWGGSPRLTTNARARSMRALQPDRIDRLHQIIDRRDFERRDRELVERGDEHDGGRRPLPGQRARDLDPVEAGHGDVEQQHVGLQRLGKAHGRFAVAGRADQVDALAARQQQLQPLGRERFVVGQQYAQAVRVRHRRPPEA